MWPVDTDAYLTWRIEHQVVRTRADRLLNSVGTADRGPPLWRWSSMLPRRLLAKARKWVSLRRQSAASNTATLTYTSRYDRGAPNGA